jgi:predicted transcriptional regulator of viral defense system
MAAHDAQRRLAGRAPDENGARADVLVARLAAQQDGVVSLRQLQACGVSSSAVSTRVRNGRLHRMHRGVYAVGHLAVPPLGRLRAAVLACGNTAVLSHFSAAEFWDLVAVEARAPQVSVSDSAGRRIPGLRVHRRRSLVERDVWIRHGIRVTSPARTILDIAADLTDHGLRRTVRRAQAEGRVNVRQLLEVLARAHGHRGSAALRAVVADGPVPTRSELEDVVLDLIVRASSEEPEVNALLRLDGERAIRPDFLWRRLRLVIEADGAAWHDDKITREDDAGKQAILEAHGYRVLRITWDQAVRHPQQTLARIRAALAAAVERPP